MFRRNLPKYFSINVLAISLGLCLGTAEAQVTSAPVTPPPPNPTPKLPHVATCKNANMYQFRVVINIDANGNTLPPTMAWVQGGNTDYAFGDEGGAAWHCPTSDDCNASEVCQNAHAGFFTFPPGLTWKCFCVPADLANVQLSSATHKVKQGAEKTALERVSERVGISVNYVAELRATGATLDPQMVFVVESARAFEQGLVETQKLRGLVSGDFAPAIGSLLATEDADIIEAIAVSTGSQQVTAISGLE